MAYRTRTRPCWLTAQKLLSGYLLMKLGISLKTFEAECDFKIGLTCCIERFARIFTIVWMCA